MPDKWKLSDHRSQELWCYTYDLSYKDSGSTATIMHVSVLGEPHWELVLMVKEELRPLRAEFLKRNGSKYESPEKALEALEEAGMEVVL